MKALYITNSLTSSKFYSYILPQLMRNSKHEVLIDMSDATRINALVIPNLICISLLVDSAPLLFIPDTLEGRQIKNYLYEIGFTQIVHTNNLYKFIGDPFGGLEGKQIDPICKTFLVNNTASNDDILYKIDRYISPFSEAYLSEFMVFDNSRHDYKNEIASFLEELLRNCRDHANTVSITTLHANFSENRIYISVSDVGGGFSSTVSEETFQTEYEAIMHCVYKNKKSKIYGLYNIIIRVLEREGIVRVHSNDTQVIFTPRLLENEAFKKEDFQAFLYQEKSNVRNTSKYEGVHIEIELPFLGGNN